VRGPGGQTVFESGALNSNGSIEGNDNDAGPLRYEPHYAAIGAAGQVQIYESVMADHTGAVTTGLLRAVRYVKDNRLLPAGFAKSTADRDIAVVGDASGDEDFGAGGDRIRYSVPLAGAAGPLRIEVELLYQPVAYRWASNLRLYDAEEPRRFVGFYDAMARASVAPLEHLRSDAFLAELKRGGVPPETVADFAAQAGQMRDAVAVVFPAVWIIGAAVLVLANAALLRLYLLRRDPGWLEDGEFERVRFPLALVAAFVVSGAAVAVPVLRPSAYNVLLVVAFFFALQGLAVVAFYARRLAAPPLLRLAVLVLVLANPWAPQILALLGLFDNWFDFRKWAEPPRPA
jgi:hypothetical protein